MHIQAVIPAVVAVVRREQVCDDVDKGVAAWVGHSYTQAFNVWCNGQVASAWLIGMGKGGHTCRCIIRGRSWSLGCRINRVYKTKIQQGSSTRFPTPIYTTSSNQLVLWRWVASPCERSRNQVAVSRSKTRIYKPLFCRGVYQSHCRWEGGMSICTWSLLIPEGEDAFCLTYIVYGSWKRGITWEIQNQTTRKEWKRIIDTRLKQQPLKFKDMWAYESSPRSQLFVPGSRAVDIST